MPISWHPVEDDAAAIAEALVANVRPGVPVGVRETVELVGGCRVIVAGSYHAALFGLAQGVPAVCFAASQYYVDKFAGLAAQFRDGCHVVRLDERGGVEAALEATASLWKAAPAARA